MSDDMKPLQHEFPSDPTISSFMEGIKSMNSIWEPLQPQQHLIIGVYLVIVGECMYLV